MGERGNKLVLPRDESGLPIAAHVVRVAAQVSPRVAVLYADAPVRSALLPWVPEEIAWVRDVACYEGPLAALGRFVASREERVAPLLVLAGDLPGISAAHAAALISAYGESGADVAAAVREGQLQPLAAVYGERAVEAMAHASARGERRLQKAIAGLNVCTVEWEDAWAVRPVHRPEDYEAWLKREGDA